MANGLKYYAKEFVHQGLLEKVVRRLFPKEHIPEELPYICFLIVIHILSNARKDTIKNPVTGSFLELDVWLPKHKICFEFQDEYHYITTWANHVPLDSIQHKDDIHVIQKKGDTVIIVPCWWDGTASSLVASVRLQRPDLLTQYSKFTNPIPLNPPIDFFQRFTIPYIGELMLASFPLAAAFNSSLSKENPWWMGEKYDGVRCCWNSFDQTLYTRAATEIILPQKMTDSFPDMCLDAEIWFGKGSFIDSQRIIVTDTNVIDWSHMRLIAFDDPDPVNHNLPFEDRLRNVMNSCGIEHEIIITASRVFCPKKSLLTTFITTIIDEGGEGVILRKPKSMYVPGRSPFLVKLKANRGDDEALVVEVEGDTVTLQLPDETLFQVTLEDFVHNTKPKEGDVVTFTYQSYSRYSVPIQPKIYRIREDVAWEDVVRDFASKSVQGNIFSDASQLAVSEVKPVRSAAEKSKEMRMFFEKYAKSNNFDPLVPENWYNISRQEVLSIKGATAILSSYRGSVKRAIIDLFPEIGLDPSKFTTLPYNYWFEMANRRKFLVDFAKHKGFDPLVPENWYPLLAEQNLEHLNARLLSFYGGSLPRTLVNIFPEIGLDIEKFARQPRNYWAIEANQRKFFIDFARANNFDYRVPENWYFSTADTNLSSVLRKTRGSDAILIYYNRNFMETLVHLFPEINFNKDKFIFAPRYLQSRSKVNGKVVFDRYAAKNNFDPLVPDNWYPITREKMKNFPGVTILTDYYGSLPKALMRCYPNIGLVTEGFALLPRFYWVDMDNRRNLFLNFAKQKRFDPRNPKNWYRIDKDDILAVKGAPSLLKKYYHNRISDALIHLFPEIGLQKTKFKKNQ